MQEMRAAFHARVFWRFQRYGSVKLASSYSTMVAIFAQISKEKFRKHLVCAIFL